MRASHQHKLRAGWRAFYLVCAAVIVGTIAVVMSGQRIDLGPTTAQDPTATPTPYVIYLPILRQYRNGESFECATLGSIGQPGLPLRICKLQVADLRLILPWQGNSVHPNRLPLPTALPPSPNDELVNPEVLDKFDIRGEESGDKLLTFQAPYPQLEVHFTKAKLDKVGGIERLAVGFWDGKKWVAFNAQQHGFQIRGSIDPANGGAVTAAIGYAILKEWDDYVIGWGQAASATPIATATP